MLAHVLDTLGLPQLDRPRFWFDGVMPRIQQELANRDRKLRNWALDQGSRQESRGPVKSLRKAHHPRKIKVEVRG